MGVVCDQCGNEFKRVATHWAQSTCEYPSLTYHQREVLTGIIMGDGCLEKYNTNPQVKVSAIKEEYLQYLDEKFGIISNGVTLENTAANLRENNKRSGVNVGTVDDYNDVWKWRTKPIPDLYEYDSWYETVGKVWPSSLELTPTVLKHWYVGDGHYNNKEYHKSLGIIMTKEGDNKDKIETYFENVGLPSTPHWNVTKNENKLDFCEARWGVDESKRLWEYMLEDGYGIPPGYEYKWPSEFRD